MKITDTIRRAGRSLRQAKARTLLTSLAISVGAFTVTIALAAGAGTQAYTNNLLKSNGDERSLSIFAQSSNQNQTPQEYEPGSSQAAQQGLLGDADITKISSVQGVENVVPIYSVNPTYMTRDSNATKYETSVAIKSDRTVITLEAGQLNSDNELNKGQVVVPDEYLGVLGFKDANDAIGKTVTVHFDPQPVTKATAGGKDWTFTVAAVNKQSSLQLRYSPKLQISTDDGKDIYDFQHANADTENTYSGATARVADGATINTVKQAVKDAGYQVLSLKDVEQTLFQIIDLAKWGAVGFGFLAILASIFGIINTQYISVLERTHQIGLMKALGARRRDVGRLFRYEAAWVGFLGGVIGTGLALLTSLVNPWIATQLSLEPGTQLLLFKPLTSIVLIIGLMVVAVIAGYFPSRKAAKLDPIEALRTE